jgi:hypothetical protein
MGQKLGSTQPPESFASPLTETSTSAQYASPIATRCDALYAASASGGGRKTCALSTSYLT